MYCVETLPRHMVPTLWRTVAELPRTASGKLDRGRLVGILEEQDGRQDQDSLHQMGEGASLRATLAALLARHVGVDSIEHRANFFDLGANSMSLTLFRKDIERYLKIDVPLVDLFDYGSIDALASHLSSRVEMQP